MILEIIGLLRDMIIYILSGIVNGLGFVIETLIKCAIIVKDEAAHSSPLELIIVLVFFIGLGWVLFKYLIGSAETFIKFIAVLGVLSVFTLIVILWG